mgnify:CR=1 FL=1
MKKILALLLTAVFVLGMAACAASPAAPTQTTSDTASDASDTPASNAETPAASSGAKLRFVTGGESGTYYAFGSVIAQHATNNAGVDIVGLVGNGSQSNIFELEDGNAELAFCQSDVMAYAYDGTNLFADTGAVSCFSTVAALYTEQVQIVTTDPEIKSVDDLKGKNVSIGAAGSGVYFNAMDVLSAYGLTESDINPTYQSFGDSADSLKNGQIDAAFIVAGAPTTAITDLATTKDVYLVSLDDEHVDQLLASSPYYTKVTIGKDVYGLDTDTITVAVSAVVLARDDVSEDAIYKLVADIFDNAASLIDTHAKYAEVSTEFGASVTSVPYHPGAAKYFAEKGFEVAAVKDGAGNTDSRNLRFVTGGESGTYYAFGSVIAQHATNNAGVNVVGLVGNGSQANVQELVDGTADFAFCQSDVMAYAYNGTNLFESKVEGFSTVAALYMEQVQIVTTNASIKTVADLAGKSVSIGAPGSGVYFNAIDVLGAYGLTEDDIKPTYQSFSDSADALKNGQIDAAFIVAGAPTTAVTDLATTKDTYLVSLDSEHIAKLLEVSQSAVSHQLRILKQSQLVKSRRDGKSVFYSLADDHVYRIINQGFEHIKE